MTNKQVQRPKKKLKPIDVMWVLSIITIGGSLINPYMILVAIPCMMAPVFAGIIKNKTVTVCSSTCGRGSFLIKIWNKVSLKKKMPMFFNAKWFKLLGAAILLTLFFRNIICNLILLEGDFFSYKLLEFSYNLQRMIYITGIIALFVGFIFKPKTWCVFCPMGNTGKVLGKALHKNKK